MKSVKVFSLIAALMLIVSPYLFAEDDSEKFTPKIPVPAWFGEKEPLLAGSSWTMKEGTPRVYQLKPGGVLLVSNNTANPSNWMREGDTVILFENKEGNYYYMRWQGTYDSKTKTIKGFYLGSDGHTFSFTMNLVPGTLADESPELDAIFDAVTKQLLENGLEWE